MNVKSFAIGFTTMDSVIGGVSATKRGIVGAAKSTAHGAQATSDVVTSFFAGAKQAVKCRNGTCRMLTPTLTHDVRSAPEIRALTHEGR